MFFQESVNRFSTRRFPSQGSKKADSNCLFALPSNKMLPGLSKSRKTLIRRSTTCLSLFCLKNHRFRPNQLSGGRALGKLSRIVVLFNNNVVLSALKTRKIRLNDPQSAPHCCPSKTTDFDQITSPRVESLPNGRHLSI